MRLAQREHAASVVALADPDLLRQRANTLGLALRIIEIDAACDISPQPAGSLQVLPHKLAAAVTPGKLDARNSKYVLNTLDTAVNLCLQGTVDALVTGPVNKAVINNAGIVFTGHTGYLAERTNGGEPVMMLACPGLRVALASVHLPLSQVPAAITKSGLQHTLEVLDSALRRQFGIANPKILVAGLNPHAGESGYLGREEIDIIEPVLKQLRAAGMHLTGPLPADTLFTPDKLAHCDAVLAMFHDQGLPVIKHLGFGKTVNVTLGLPIIRTSVDHGTALELAGSNNVDSGSLDAALAMAIDIAHRTRASA